MLIHNTQKVACSSIPKTNKLAVDTGMYSTFVLSQTCFCFPAGKTTFGLSWQRRSGLCAKHKSLFMYARMKRSMAGFMLLIMSVMASCSFRVQPAVGLRDATRSLHVSVAGIIHALGIIDVNVACHIQVGA